MAPRAGLTGGAAAACGCGWSLRGTAAAGGEGAPPAAAASARPAGAGAGAGAAGAESVGAGRLPGSRKGWLKHSSKPMRSTGFRFSSSPAGAPRMRCSHGASVASYSKGQLKALAGFKMDFDVNDAEVKLTAVY